MVTNMMIMTCDRVCTFQKPETWCSCP